MAEELEIKIKRKLDAKIKSIMDEISREIIEDIKEVVKNSSNPSDVEKSLLEKMYPFNKMSDYIKFTIKSYLRSMGYSSEAIKEYTHGLGDLIKYDDFLKNYPHIPYNNKENININNKFYFDAKEDSYIDHILSIINSHKEESEPSNHEQGYVERKYKIISVLRKYLKDFPKDKLQEPDSSKIKKKIEKKSIIKVEYSYDDKEWESFEANIYPNQELNAIIWGCISRLSEEDKKRFFEERIDDLLMGDLINDERAHSTTGIESLLINKFINITYSKIMPKISLGCGEGNDLMEGDIGIDINSSNKKVIKSDVVDFDFSSFSEFKTISFPYSIHSIPLDEILSQIKDFENFIITLPYNGNRKEKFIKKLLDASSDKRLRDDIKIYTKYTYSDGSSRIKKISGTLLYKIKGDISLKVLNLLNSHPEFAELRAVSEKEFNYVVENLEKARMHTKISNYPVYFDKKGGNVVSFTWALRYAKMILEEKKFFDGLAGN